MVEKAIMNPSECSQYKNTNKQTKTPRNSLSSFGNNKSLERVNMAPFFFIQSLLSVGGIFKAGY